MPKFAADRRLAHSAKRMFDLVSDCEAYPEFVPHCDKLVVTVRGEEGGNEVIVADMTVAYGAVHETFTTRSVFDRGALVIDVTYLDGPFRKFDSRWQFEPTDKVASTVRFSVEYELRSRILTALLGPIVARSFDEIIAAFETRADAVYARAV